MEIILTFVVFFLSISLHVVVHRVLVRGGIKTLVSMAVFLPGFIFLAVFLFKNPENFQFPVSVLLLYLLFWIFHTICFVAASFGGVGGEQPSGRILFFIQKRGKARYQEILRLFTNQELVEKQIADLIRGTYITKKGDTLRMLPKGARLHQALDSYRQLLRWESSG